VIGFFPSNFCELIKEAPPAASPAKPATPSKPVPEVKAPSTPEASSEILQHKEGPLKIYLNGVWKSGFAAVVGDHLVVTDSKGGAVELGRASLAEPVRRGAPSEVVPPKGEDNCQFSIEALLLSAPSFAVSQDWMAMLKTYYTIHRGSSGALSPSSSGSPLRGRAGSSASSLTNSPASSRPKRASGILSPLSLRKGSLRGNPTPEKSASPSPGRKTDPAPEEKQKSSGSDNLGKKV
jgi:hypothetical protein